MKHIIPQNGIVHIQQRWDRFDCGACSVMHLLQMNLAIKGLPTSPFNRQSSVDSIAEQIGRYRPTEDDDCKYAPDAKGNYGIVSPSKFLERVAGDSLGLRLVERRGSLSDLLSVLDRNISVYLIIEIYLPQHPIWISHSMVAYGFEKDILFIRDSFLGKPGSRNEIPEFLAGVGPHHPYRNRAHLLWDYYRPANGEGPSHRLGFKAFEHAWNFKQQPILTHNMRYLESATK